MWGTADGHDMRPFLLFQDCVHPLVYLDVDILPIEY